MDQNIFQQPAEQSSLNQQNLHSEIPSSGSKIKWILLVIVLLLLVGFGAYSLGVNKNKLLSQNQQAVTSTQLVPTPTTDPAVSWKIYSGAKYSIKYPSNWFAYDYKDVNSCVALSDIQNPTDIPVEISPNGHAIVSVCFYQAAMPSSFPYSNGSSSNQTIMAFNVNGYSGIRGQSTSTIGITENVLLNDTKGDYVQIQNQIGDLSTFDQILSTFKFTDQNQIDPTVNWKTYINTQNFYSFRYPDTIFSIQESGSRTRLLKGMGYGFEVNVIQTTDTAENWLIKEKSNGQFPDNNWKFTQSTFQSHPALLLQSLPNTMQVAMDVFIVKNKNMIYEISFSKETSDKTVIDQILSTFKFTN